MPISRLEIVLGEALRAGDIVLLGGSRRLRVRERRDRDVRDATTGEVYRYVEFVLDPLAGDGAPGVVAGQGGDCLWATEVAS